MGRIVELKLVLVYDFNIADFLEKNIDFCLTLIQFIFIIFWSDPNFLHGKFEITVIGGRYLADFLFEMREYYEDHLYWFDNLTLVFLRWMRVWFLLSKHVKYLLVLLLLYLPIFLFDQVVITWAIMLHFDILYISNWIIIPALDNLLNPT